MSIEIKTLYHLSVTVSALLGVLLFYSWWLNRRVEALGWWGAGMVAIAVGLALVAARGGIHHALSIAVANTVLLFASALIWTGARIFDGRRPHLPGLAAGPVIWVIACLIPAFYGAINARTLLVSALLGIYTLLAAYELWQGRMDHLRSRWLPIGLLTFHGLLFFVRLVLVAAAPLEEGLPGAGGGWFVFLHYEIVLYLIALSLALVAMSMERTERQSAAA